MLFPSAGGRPQDALVGGAGDGGGGGHHRWRRHTARCGSSIGRRRCASGRGPARRGWRRHGLESRGRVAVHLPSAGCFRRPRLRLRRVPAPPPAVSQSLARRYLALASLAVVRRRRKWLHRLRAVRFSMSHTNKVSAPRTPPSSEPRKNRKKRRETKTSKQPSALLCVGESLIDEQRGHSSLLYRAVLALCARFPSARGRVTQNECRAHRTRFFLVLYFQWVFKGTCVVIRTSFSITWLSLHELISSWF